MTTKKLIYRLPRYHVDLSVVLFTAPAHSVAGRCTDISSEGVGVRLFGETRVGEIVTINFGPDGNSVHLNARIEYRCDNNFYGLRFQLESKQERDSVAQLLQSIRESLRILHSNR